MRGQQINSNFGTHPTVVPKDDTSPTLKNGRLCLCTPYKSSILEQLPNPPPHPTASFSTSDSFSHRPLSIHNHPPSISDLRSMHPPPSPYHPKSVHPYIRTHLIAAAVHDLHPLCHHLPRWSEDSPDPLHFGGSRAMLLSEFFGVRALEDDLRHLSLPHTCAERQVDMRASHTHHSTNSMSTHF